MPLIVDAMNVIGSRPDAWWRDRHAAMVRLVDQLERWVAATGDDVTVVFERPPSPPIRSSLIEVTHAPRARANSADDELLRRLRAEPDPAQIWVVTSDHTLADLARATGATVTSSSAFRAELDELL